MESKVPEFHVLVKFVDPDNLPGSFVTEAYMEGCIVAMIPGPNKNNNWVLKLRYPIQCFDSDGKNYHASIFLLKPIGLDDRNIMKNSPWKQWILIENEKIKGLEAFASVLQENNWPTRIESYEDYNKFPFINAVILKVDSSKNVLAP